MVAPDSLGGVEPDDDDLIEALETLAQFGVPRHGTASLVDVGSGPYLDFVRDELLDGYVGMGGSAIRIIEGQYGAGKTHILQLIEELALESGYVATRTDLSEAVGFDVPRVLVKYLLQSVTVASDQGPAKGLSAVVRHLGEDPGTVGPHAGFAHAMHYMAVDPGAASSTSLRRFLGGERVTVAELRSQGFRGVKNPLSERNAELVLRTVTAGLQRTGAAGTVMLFDETEPTLARAVSVSRRQLAAANLLRRMIDQAAAGVLVGTLVVFAVLPGFIESCARAYPALGQRLAATRTPSSNPWRSPMVAVDAISTARSREQFLEAAVQRFLDLGARLGVPAASVSSALYAEGQIALAENAGAGYRRDLVRRLANVVLAEV